MGILSHKGLFVIIPAYNEEKTIAEVIRKTKKYADNIIVVDDGSSDRTYQKSKMSADDIVVLRHKINLGKGAAMKTGCEAAIKLGAEIIIAIDADGQHDPDDIPKLLKELTDKNLDIVFGSRNLSRNVPLVRAWGNKITTMAVRILSGISLKDVLSGFRIFTTAAYKKIVWQSQDYSVEVEMIINAGKNKLRYGEVPIQTIYNDKYKGMDIINGFKILIKAFIFKFS